MYVFVNRYDMRWRLRPYRNERILVVVLHPRFLHEEGANRLHLGVQLHFTLPLCRTA